MARCQAQRGFLALRPCENAAVAACTACGRTVCATHLVEGTCTECADAGADWRTDPRGPSRYRRRFHQEDSWMTDQTLFWGYGSYGFAGGAGFDESTSEGSVFDS